MTWTKAWKAARKAHRTVGLLLAVALVFGLLAVTGSARSERLPGEGKTLTLAYGNWTGDLLPIHVTKILLEEHLGYDVRVVDLAIPAIYAMVAQGQVDVWPDAWFPNQLYLLEKFKDDVEVISWHYRDAVQVWALPTWFAKKYGIQSIDDLKDPKIAKMLDRDGDGKGDLLGCETGWTCHEDNQRILKTYGLESLYTQIAASEQMINYAIDAAMQGDEPVLFYRWTPDWIFAKYPLYEDITPLADNRNYWQSRGAEVNEAGLPLAQAGTLVNKKMKREHPEAYALLSQISVPLDAVNESVYRQVIEKKTSDRELERHAREWIAKNRATVDAWLEAAGVK